MSNSLKKKACCCVFAASVTLGTLQLWPAEAVLAPNNEAPAAAVNLAAGGKTGSSTAGAAANACTVGIVTGG